jgi:hypothetical protein
MRPIGDNRRDLSGEVGHDLPPPLAGSVSGEHLHLKVAVERDSEPIRGTLDDGLVTTIEFTGWLELMSAFDTVRARATRITSETDVPTDPQ